jgi:hypothetical protein
MDFKDSIKQLADKVGKLKDSLQTEEATKNALIMPFLSALGYDVFNPLEVVPEFTCDIGTKKGEKVDYAIFREEMPAILIECKHCNKDLNLHDGQLLRYYHVSKAKFGILTNGIIYRFYADLETPNKMDEKPFLEVNLMDVKPSQIEELKKFHKTYFDVDNILNSASELKYTSELKAILNSEFNSPTPDFVKLLAKQVYSGIFTPKISEQFTALVKKSVANLISDIISDRLKTVLNTEQEEQQKAEEPAQKEEIKIVTTDEEREAYFIIKAILRPVFPIERIFYRDTQSYFSIIADDNNRKPICRFYFNTSNRQIAFIGEDKKEVKHKIDSIDDIYNFSSELTVASARYLDEEIIKD